MEPGATRKYTCALIVTSVHTSLIGTLRKERTTSGPSLATPPHAPRRASPRTRPPTMWINPSPILVHWVESCVMQRGSVPYPASPLIKPPPYTPRHEFVVGAPFGSKPNPPSCSRIGGVSPAWRVSRRSGASTPLATSPYQECLKRTSCANHPSFPSIHGTWARQVASLRHNAP